LPSRHHFASYDAIEALTATASVQAVGLRQTPSAILAVAAVVAETDAEAEKLATSMDLKPPARDRGQYLPLPSVEEALAYPTAMPNAARSRATARAVRRQPGDGVAKLQPMITASEADELMVITAVYDHDARKKSYSCCADAWGLRRRWRLTA